jgi:hypothetical protein
MGKETLRFSNAWHCWNFKFVFNLRQCPSGGISDLRAGSILVLIVEDEYLIRTHAAEVIRDAGFEVVEARNADEAMTAGRRFTSLRRRGSTHFRRGTCQ